MEFDTPLNKAHVNVRKSEKLLKCGRFEEAIELQDRIVKLLKEALEDAKEKNIRDSLELQIEYHSQQKHIIAYKKTSWERLCQQLTDLQVKMSNESNSASGVGLQDSIFRVMTETESLLEHLKVGTDTGQPTLGAKMPKDDNQIIEELQTANNHLRSMVETMFSELETFRKENAELRARVRDLEAEKRARMAQVDFTNAPATPRVGLGLQLEDSGQFPDLAPLEMPQFDFQSMH